VRTTKRVLEVLQLFTMDTPEWSIDAAAQKLALSQSTAYVYFRDLVEAALLVKSRTGFYSIGPAVIVYDRLTRKTDPVIYHAQPLMKNLIETSGVECVALLCRLFRMTVLCVAQEQTAHADFAVSYERGRPMPLFRGAASKAILAHVERRKLRRYFHEFSADIANAELGKNWTEFKSSLRRIRAANICITKGELDVGALGLSAPVFSSEGEILGSLSLVVSERALRRSEEQLEKLAAKVGKAAQSLSLSLRSGDSVLPMANGKKGPPKKTKPSIPRKGRRKPAARRRS